MRFWILKSEKILAFEVSVSPLVVPSENRIRRQREMAIFMNKTEDP
jgi:hypothetical protein